MKIAIVGPGALGSLLAASLRSKTKDEIKILDHIPERAKKISRDGIKVQAASSEYSVRIDAVTEGRDIGVCDLVILSVKSYSTDDVCEDIKDLVGDRTNILTLQNGIGNAQIISDHFAPDKVIAGVTSNGATLLSPGHVKHAGKGETIIGRPDGRVLGSIRDVAALLTKALGDTRITKDIDSVIWSKLIVNVGINALSAITRLKNGELCGREEISHVMRGAVQEAFKVVKRKRIKLLYDDPFQKTELVCKATFDNMSSMLQDILRCKKTEIDFINGSIVRQAKALGIASPINEMLVNIVKTIETSYDKTVKGL